MIRIFCDVCVNKKDSSITIHSQSDGSLIFKCLECGDGLFLQNTSQTHSIINIKNNGAGV